jgi:hypothetical protein
MIDFLLSTQPKPRSRSAQKLRSANTLTAGFLAWTLLFYSQTMLHTLRLRGRPIVIVYINVELA